MKSQTLQLRDTKYLLKNFKGDRSKFKLIDNLIFDKRCLEKKSIEDNSIEENKQEALSLILKSCSVSGFKPIPTELFLDDLCNTIIEFLLDFKYGELLWDEINLALVMNTYNELKYPSGEDYEQVLPNGNYLNLQFLTKVLTRYMIFRNNLDEMIKKMFDGIEPYSTKFNN